MSSLVLVKGLTPLAPRPTGWKKQKQAGEQHVFVTPIGSMVLPYMVTFTINIPQMLAYIPYMDPMGHIETVTDK